MFKILATILGVVGVIAVQLVLRLSLIAAAVWVVVQVLQATGVLS